MTPYELYLALTAPADSAPSWGTDWISDFEKVMNLDTDVPENEEDMPHFSLVTGKLVDSGTSRPMRKSRHTDVEYDSSDNALVKQESQVAVREDGTVAVRGIRSLAAEKLVARNWKGLDPPSTEEEGAKVELGRDGVARGYRSPTNPRTNE